MDPIPFSLHTWVWSCGRLYWESAHACMYFLHRGNDIVWSFRMYIDRTQHDEINWRPYTTHRDIFTLDPILFYSWWLACGRHMMWWYLPEECTRQFGYVNIILRSPFESASNSIVCRHLYDILADYEIHLVSEECRSMSATIQWPYVNGYMTWFYSVSHPVMTPDAPGRPPRSTHEEILENEQVRDDHAIDVSKYYVNYIWERRVWSIWEKWRWCGWSRTCHSYRVIECLGLPVVEEEPWG